MRNGVRLYGLDISEGAANPMLFTSHASINRFNFPFVIANETYAFSHACQLSVQVADINLMISGAFFNRDFIGKKKKIK